jgi:hypothetical protein
MTTNQTPPPAVWIDGDPLMEAIAAAVWERCARSDSGLVIDDPRNIAAAAVAAVSSVGQAPATDQKAVRPTTLNAIASHLEARAVRIFRPDAEVHAEYHAVAALLRRMADEAAVPGRTTDETAEADADGEALRAKVEEATATLRRVRSALRTLKDQGATGRTYHQVITDALAGPRPDAPAVGGAQQPEADRG